MTLRLAVPNKGRLHEPTLTLLDDAGVGPIDAGERRLFAPTGLAELEVVFVRTDDIPRMVEMGAIDLGITGYDLIRESAASVEELLDLGFGTAEMVVAAPDHADTSRLADVEDGATVATEFPNVAYAFFADRGVEVNLVEVSGATEITPLLGVADLIVDLRSTGTTLRTHGLEVLETIFETSVRLIANPDSLDAHPDRIEALRLAINSVLQARTRKLLLMNVPEEDLPEVRDAMPGMAGPTVSQVEGTDMVAIQVVVAESDVYELVNEARAAGGRDILVLPIERLVF